MAQLLFDGRYNAVSILKILLGVLGDELISVDTRVYEVQRQLIKIKIIMRLYNIILCQFVLLYLTFMLAI